MTMRYEPTFRREREEIFPQQILGKKKFKSREVMLICVFQINFVQKKNLSLEKLSSKVGLCYARIILV